MKYCSDLILGKAFCIFIFFHFPDSRLSVLKAKFSLNHQYSMETNVMKTKVMKISKRTGEEFTVFRIL